MAASTRSTPWTRMLPQSSRWVSTTAIGSVTRWMTSDGRRPGSSARAGRRSSAPATCPGRWRARRRPQERACAASGSTSTSWSARTAGITSAPVRAAPSFRCRRWAAPRNWATPPPHWRCSNRPNRIFWCPTTRSVPGWPRPRWRGGSRWWPASRSGSSTWRTIRTRPASWRRAWGCGLRGAVRWRCAGSSRTRTWEASCARCVPPSTSGSRSASRVRGRSGPCRWRAGSRPSRSGPCGMPRMLQPAASSPPSWRSRVIASIVFGSFLTVGAALSWLGLRVDGG